MEPHIIAKLITENIKINNGLIFEEEMSPEEIERGEAELEQDDEWTRRERELQAQEDAESDRYREWVNKLKEQLGATNVTDEAEAEKLEEWFKEAFIRGLPADLPENTKKATIDFINSSKLKDRILGGMTVYRPHGKGALLGHFTDNGVFVVTHFAPDKNNRMSAVSVCRSAFKSDYPILFGVTRNLSAMLQKIGFKKLGSFEMKFHGITEIKDVMVNDTLINDPQTLRDVAEDLKYKYGIDIEGFQECSVCGQKNIFNKSQDPVCDKCKREYQGTSGGQDIHRQLYKSLSPEERAALV
jgi:hypothetical protein